MPIDGAKISADYLAGPAVLTDSTIIPVVTPLGGGLYSNGAAALSAFGIQRVSNVALYGAVGDGVTDDTAAIQAAFTALGSGPGIVYSPFTAHKVSSTIQIGNGSSSAKSTINAIGFVGKGGLPTTVTGEDGGTRLLWYGTDGGGPVIKVAGPLTNVYIDNFMIDCKPSTNGAAIGLQVYHCHNGVFRRIAITNYSDAGLDIDAVGSAGLPTGVTIGGDDCVYERVDAVTPSGNNAIGLRLGPATAGGTATDNARNSFTNCWFHGSNHANGIGAELRFTDNCSFYQCGFQAGAGQRAIYCQPPSGSVSYPSAMQFFGCFVVGTVTADPTWVPAISHGLGFYGLSTTDSGTTPSGAFFHGREGTGAFFGPTIFNEHGDDADFRVEGDTKPNLFMIDASTDRIGVFTPAPGCALDIADTGLTGATKGLRIIDLTSGHALREYIDTATAGAYVGTPGATALHLQTGAVDRIDIGAAGGIVINESGADADLRIEGDTEPNLFFIDASTNQIGIGTATPGNRIHAFAAATSDVFFSLGTDPTNGPCLNFGYGGASFARGACFFNARADASAVAPEPSIRFSTANVVRVIIDSAGNLGLGTTAFGTNAAGVIGVKNGTAPTTGPADTVQLYSSDNTAGNTIPSFFCEGTEVLATGQADSASSVRVKMRINGTVVTFLCI